MKREAGIACTLPAVLLVLLMVGACGIEWMRPVSPEAVFAIPVADILRSHGVRVYRISRASHYEGGAVDHAAMIQTSDGAVSLLQFTNEASAERAVTQWSAPRSLLTRDGTIVLLTSSPGLQQTLLKNQAR